MPTHLSVDHLLRRSARVSVVRPGASRAQGFEAFVASRFGDILLLRGCASAGWREDEEVILFTVDARGQLFCGAATAVSSIEDQSRFRISTVWSATDSRTDPRYPVLLPAEVLVPSHDLSLTATVVDISLGGFAIEVSSPLPANEILVRVHGFDDAPTLAGTVVSSDPRGASFLAHIQVHSAAPRELAFLQDIVQRLARAMDLGRQQAA